jgi:hypothetical protein
MRAPSRRVEVDRTWVGIIRSGGLGLVMTRCIARAFADHQDRDEESMCHQ